MQHSCSFKKEASMLQHALREAVFSCVHSHLFHFEDAALLQKRIFLFKQKYLIPVCNTPFKETEYVHVRTHLKSRSCCSLGHEQKQAQALPFFKPISSKMRWFRKHLKARALNSESLVAIMFGLKKMLMEFESESLKFKIKSLDVKSGPPHVFRQAARSKGEDPLGLKSRLGPPQFGCHLPYLPSTSSCRWTTVKWMFARLALL